MVVLNSRSFKLLLKNIYRIFNAQIKSSVNEDISILVKLDNHPWNYLCECGDASDLTIKEIQDCNAIFISHTHIDHFVNFDAVIRHQIGIERRVVICGPENISKHVQARLKSYTWNLIQKGSIIYEIREVVSENKIVVYEIEPPFWELIKIGEQDNNILFEEKSFTVSSVILDHKTPTLAYKFKENETLKIDIQKSGFKGGKWVKGLKDAFINKDNNAVISIDEKDYQAHELYHLLHIQEGDSVGVIMDHAANHENHSKIKDHFWKCRQVFIESFYKEADQELAALNFHSFSTQSGKIMSETEVDEPIPVHFSRKYKEHDLKELMQEFESEAYKNKNPN
ncbi:peptidase [Limibacter armeniacum]|uniref:peptidase n=1 Tax=Limibacter armeniacum TaxID=466084 RepID=UPI002FE6469A